MPLLSGMQHAAVKLLVAAVVLFATVCRGCFYSDSGNPMTGPQGGGCSAVTLTSMSIVAASVAGFNMSLIDSNTHPTDIAFVLNGVSLLSKSVVFVAGFSSVTVISSNIRYCNVTISGVTGTGAILVQGAFPSNCNITITDTVLTSTAATDLSNIGVSRSLVAKSLVFQNVHLLSATLTVSHSQLKPYKMSSAAIFVDGPFVVSSSVVTFQNVTVDATIGVDISVTSALSGIDRSVSTRCDQSSVVTWSSMTVSGSVAAFALDTATLLKCTILFSGGQWSSGGTSAGYTVYLVSLTLSHASISWESCTLSDSHSLLSKLQYWGSFSVVEAVSFNFYNVTWAAGNSYGLYVATDLSLGQGSSLVLQRLSASPTNLITVFMGGGLILQDSSTFVIDRCTMRSSNGVTIKVLGAVNVTNRSSISWTSSSLGSPLGAVLMSGGALLATLSYWYMWNCTILCANGDGIEVGIAFTVTNRSAMWYDNNTIQVNERGVHLSGDVTWVRNFSSLILTDTVMKSSTEDLVWTKVLQISNNSWVHLRGTQGIASSAGKGLLRVSQAAWEATGTLSVADNYMTSPVGTEAIAFILDLSAPIATSVLLRCNYLRSVLISPVSAYNANALVVDGTVVVVLGCNNRVPAGSQCFPNLTQFADSKLGGCSCLPGAYTKLCLPVNIQGAPPARRYSPSASQSSPSSITHSATDWMSGTRRAPSQSESLRELMRTATVSWTSATSVTRSVSHTRLSLTIGASSTNTGTAPPNSVTVSFTPTGPSKSQTASTNLSTTKRTFSTEASFSPTYYRVKTRTSAWEASASGATPTPTKRLLSWTLSSSSSLSFSVSRSCCSVSATPSSPRATVSLVATPSYAKSRGSGSLSVTPSSSRATVSLMATPSDAKSRGSGSVSVTASVTHSLQYCRSQLFFLRPSANSMRIETPVNLSASTRVNATLGDLVTWGIQRGFNTTSIAGSDERRIPSALVSFAMMPSDSNNGTTTDFRSGATPTLLCDEAVAQLVEPTGGVDVDPVPASNVSVAVLCVYLTPSAFPATQEPTLEVSVAGSGCLCNSTVWGSGLIRARVAVDITIPYRTWCGPAPPVLGALTVHVEGDNFGPLVVPSPVTLNEPIVRAAQTVTRVASVASMGSVSPITASNIARITALQRLVVCRVTADNSNNDGDNNKDDNYPAPAGVLPLSFGPSPHATSRGTLVSNMALLVGFTLGVGVLAVALLSGIGGMRRALALTLVHWHSVGLVPLLGIMQPTTTCAVILFATGGSSWAGDVPLAALWVAGAAACVCWIWWTVKAKQFPCVLQRLPPRRSAPGTLDGGTTAADSCGLGRSGFVVFREKSMAAWRAFSQYALRGTEHWTMVDESRPLWKKQFFFLLAELRVPWYLPLDLSFSVLIGVIAGIPSSSTSVCIVQVTCVILVYLILVIICVTKRPFLQPFMFAYTVAVNVLGVVAAVLLCLAVAHGDPERRLETGVATLALMVSGMSMAKSSVDAMELLAALRRMKSKWTRARAAPGTVAGRSPAGNAPRDSDTAVELQSASSEASATELAEPPNKREFDGTSRGGAIPATAPSNTQSDIDFNFVAQWSDYDDGSDEDEHQREMGDIVPASGQLSSDSAARVITLESLVWCDSSGFALNDEADTIAAANDLELAYQQFCATA